jgi:hypothetical protein
VYLPRFVSSLITYCDDFGHTPNLAVQNVLIVQAVQTVRRETLFDQSLGQTDDLNVLNDLNRLNVPTNWGLQHR